MNIFQKIGIFVYRLLGVVCLFFGVSGIAYGLMLQSVGMPDSAGMTAGYSLFSGAFYFVLGLALLLFSGPLGRLLGSGLDDIAPKS
jgi:hypothetical protein